MHVKNKIHEYEILAKKCGAKLHVTNIKVRIMFGWCVDGRMKYLTMNWKNKIRRSDEKGKKTKWALLFLIIDTTQYENDNK